MKKKFCIILLALIALFAIPSQLFATPLIQVGAVADFGSFSDTSKKDGFFDGLGLGLDARFNLFNWVSFDLPLVFSKTDAFTVSTMPSVNLNIPALSFLDISLGAGTYLAISNHEDRWYMNGISFDNAGEAFRNAGIFYRAAVTFNLAWFGVGLNLIVPAEGTFNNFSAVPDFDQTRLTASMLFNFL